MVAALDFEIDAIELNTEELSGPLSLRDTHRIRVAFISLYSGKTKVHTTCEFLLAYAL